MSQSSPGAHISITDPVRVGMLQLPNRLIKAATYEGMTPSGICSRQLIDFHCKMVRGGVGLTTVAYAAVSPDGRTHEDQLLVDAENESNFKDLTSAIHREGGLVSIQLTHCGFFTRNRHLSTRTPASASRTFNSYGALLGLPFSHAMSLGEMSKTAEAFELAASRIAECGFDAIELHMGHGYLLSQFISPATNRRNDAYGGSVKNRFRFPGEVLHRVKRAAGKIPVIVKMNVADGFRNGLDPKEANQIAQLLQEHGADAIVTSGGFTSRSPFFLMRGDVPWQGMIRAEKHPLQKAAIALFGPYVMKKFGFAENYFLDMASTVKDVIDIPVFYSGGVISSQGISTILDSGFAGVAVGRALLHNPSLINDISNDSEYVSACNHCNECMVEMDRGGVRCVL